MEAVLPAAVGVDGLTGMGAALGTATGRARVINDPKGARIEPGEILVAPTTDPGWTPLFMTATGLVTETGSPMAHGPTVAREYGIPAVICVREATMKISTGQLITIDGAAGTVRTDADIPAAQLDSPMTPELDATRIDDSKAGPIDWAPHSRRSGRGTVLRFAGPVRAPHRLLIPALTGS